MTHEDKELLLQDLSARLPYGVIVKYKSREGEGNAKITSGNIGYVTELDDGWWDECKPYLRPMSSMTDEEYDQLYIDSRVKEDSVDILDALANDMDAIDWLNAHHFDYRGLIEKGLAISVTKENNPYKE